MRKSSFRPRTTSYASSASISLTTGRSARGSISSRKISHAFSDVPNNGSSSKECSFIDDAQITGRVKIFTAIKSPDRCTSLNYRSDGRFYAVGLADGTIQVYSSKTDNILYTLNNEDIHAHSFSDISTTCVRFRPSPGQYQSTEYSGLSNNKERLTRNFSRTGSLTEVDHFLPPINTTPRSSVPQVHLRRRKSSTSALGLNLELGLFSTSSEDKCMPNNLVSASFTDGYIKTFNFLTEKCVEEMKEDREILTMEYNKSGDMLATGGEDGCIHVYDVETGTLKCSYEPSFDYDRKFLRTYSIAFHPVSEEELISGGWNKSIQFYDTRVPNLLVGKVPGPKITGNGLSFHSTGKEFCAAAWGNKEGLYIFDYAMKQPIENIFETSNKSDFVSLSSIRSATRTKREKHHFPSAHLYSAQYFLDNYVAVCGAFPGSMAIVELYPDKKVVASISDLPRSVFALDVMKTKIAFILGDEVCCSEIFI